MIKFLPGLFTFFFLTTVVYAAASSIGFDKPDYLIAPSTSQQIYAELIATDGTLVKATSATRIYLTPGSSTGQISKTISKPVFASPSATVYITVSTGDYRKSFLYLDSVLGTSYLTATSSGLLNGTLKITIGFPPPPPPLVQLQPPPARIVSVSPVVPVEVTPPSIVEIVPTKPLEIASTVFGEPVVSAVNISPPIEIKVSNKPTVLAVTSAQVKPRTFEFLDQLLTWLQQAISDNIGL